MNKIIEYSELYFTQYSAYSKFSIQNYSLHFEGRNIISEKLLNAFIENNITGYEVSEYDILKTE